MDNDDHPLAQPLEALDAEGRTRDQAIAEELQQNGELGMDWLNAKDRHEGRVTTHGTFEPTPKPVPIKIKIDPRDKTPAEFYRGKKPIEPRVEPKPGAHRHPRIKDVQNNPGPKNGWER